jgi:hypothetical protein
MIAVTLLVLAGCSDNGFNSLGDNSLGNPGIKVYPEFVDFGAVSLDDEPMLRTFTIESVGDMDLEIDSVALDDNSSAFRMITDVGGLRLPPGSKKEVEVEFFPLIANDNVGTTIVASQDPLSPTLPVKLIGTGNVPELRIDPDPLDVGSTFVGCPEDNHVTLTNVGLDTLVVENIEQEGVSFTLAHGLSLPLELEPGASKDVSFTFDPSDDVEYSAEIGVTSNEPLGFRTASQVGAGKFSGNFDDQWEIPEDQPTDVLFIVDQSGSMDDNAAALGEQFDYYINNLSLFTGDWQIMVANTADGCNTTGILTPSTADYVAKFQAEINTGDGQQYIDDPEMLLTAADNSIQRALPGMGDCNDGFMRSGSILHIILVSDEPEQSPNGWDWYVDRIITAKGDESKTRISSVAGNMDGTCTEAGASSQPGVGYYEATQATGGVYLDICSDWATNMEALALASAQLDTFALSNDPVVNTIVVNVNGQTLTDGWLYDAESNSVVFTDPKLVPTSGDFVDIQYGGAAPCDPAGDE